MIEEGKKEYSSFFNEIRRERKEFLSKKEYQITLKDSIIHITEVIKNQANNEQLKEYKKIDTRVQDVITKIDDIIKNIISIEKILEDIQQVLEEVLNSDTEISLVQTTFLQNEIMRYNEKKKEIERQIESNRVGFVLRELNYFSDKVKINKCHDIGNETQVIELNVHNGEDFVNKIRQSMNVIPQEENQEVNSVQNSQAIDTVEETLQIENSRENNRESESEDENTNILIISEREKVVHLPYKQTDIKHYLQTGKFSSKEEVVRKIYTVPLSKYTNYTVSRLTEGFKLMREREKAPFGESLKYAFSLIWERKLHPAIITACRTQDDLDIYLACLEDNMLPLFDSFEVRFDYRPIKAKQNARLEYYEGV